jgi:hypothetical protein
MKTGYLWVLILLVAIIFVSGCAKLETVKEGPNLSDRLTSCVYACQKALNASRNLDAGPCLLDPFPQDSDWVCDVANSPRQDVDNLAENQCQAYRNGTAKHFVEVTPTCEYIRQN